MDLEASMGCFKTWSWSGEFDFGGSLILGNFMLTKCFGVLWCRHFLRLWRVVVLWSVRRNKNHVDDCHLAVPAGSLWDMSEPFGHPKKSENMSGGIHILKSTLFCYWWSGGFSEWRLTERKPQISAWSTRLNSWFSRFDSNLICSYVFVSEDGQQTAC